MTTTASPAPGEAQRRDALSVESSTATPDLTGAPTEHAGLLAWVAEVAALTQPDRIHWVDGSDEEYAQLTDELIAAGTMVRLNDELKPNSFWTRTDPSDVARVEQRTIIC